MHDSTEGSKLVKELGPHSVKARVELFWHSVRDALMALASPAELSGREGVALDGGCTRMPEWTSRIERERWRRLDSFDRVAHVEWVDLGRLGMGS